MTNEFSNRDSAQAAKSVNDLEAPSNGYLTAARSVRAFQRQVICEGLGAACVPGWTPPPRPARSPSRMAPGSLASRGCVRISARPSSERLAFDATPHPEKRIPFDAPINPFAYWRAWGVFPIFPEIFR
jgi:hypothetical protein